MAVKLRYWYRLSKAFVVRFRAVLLIGIILGLLIFSVFQFWSPNFLYRQKDLVGMTGRYHVEELPRDILSLIGEGLTNLDETGQVTPGLAKEWESDEEGKVWTFHLDENKTWHDGTKVRASDISYEFEDASIQIPDENTIVFELTTPFSPFPVVVSRPTFKRGLLGTGEWRVKDISLNNQFVEDLTLVNTDGHIKIIRFYPTEDTTKIGFQLGEVDILEGLLDPYPFETWNNVNIEEEINNNMFVAIFFNNQQDPFLKNKPFRQALAYAINKENFSAPRAIGPISPDSWAYNSQVKDYAYDLDRAIELMKDNMPEELIANTNITLSTSPVLLPVAETVATYWRQLGIGVDVTVTPTIPQDYQAFLAIYHAPDDPDQYSMWHSKQLETNISKFENQRIDTLLENGRLELDSQERKRIYLDFQRFLLEESPAVFLYHPKSYTVIRK